MSDSTPLAYFVVFFILIMFVFILSGCYIKQTNSEKFYSPQLQMMGNPQPPVGPDTPKAECEGYGFF